MDLILCGEHATPLTSTRYGCQAAPHEDHKPDQSGFFIPAAQVISGYGIEQFAATNGFFKKSGFLRFARRRALPTTLM
jgi:hypothetical protein